MEANEIMDRIRSARDHALEQEREERQNIADADTADKQGAASVRLATRQAVREPSTTSSGRAPIPRRTAEPTRRHLRTSGGPR
ncbi:hypothetical protein [Kocuria sp. CNJ-770]|uniref:hypothetical protein n=1 Tax=Kocuria sp. CNJ-770 TaxID=1904964 RepID=UPI000A5EC13E|nr:hypothetical protein [Kocuria sp. CNJ-770]